MYVLKLQKLHWGSSWNCHPFSYPWHPEQKVKEKQACLNTFDFGMTRNLSRFQPTRAGILPWIPNCSQLHVFWLQHPHLLLPCVPWISLGWKTNGFLLQAALSTYYTVPPWYCAKPDAPKQATTYLSQGQWLWQIPVSSSPSFSTSVQLRFPHPGRDLR